MTGRTTGEAPRYRLDALIATGGMGEVWRATDTVLDREVAVKVLKREYADDPAFRSRFEAEARHAAALHHANVASVFDFGQRPDEDGTGPGRPFLVMELVPGRPLSALLHDGAPMPPATAAELVAQAADAIAAAHALDIVHRDVKPANLLVTPEGSVKITDFGIARAADDVALTRTGQLMGTPHYLSPEQVEGRPATSASDIYALGVVLYECLAGRRPFVGDTPVSTALAHLREPVPPLPAQVPAHLRRVVARALAKDPAQRFPSAAGLADALRGGPVDAPVPPATVTLGDTTVAGAGAAGAAAALAVPSGDTRDDAGWDDDAWVDGAGGRRTPLPPWWPWAAAAVAVLLVVAVLSQLGRGRDAVADSTGAASASPGVTAPGAGSDRVRVRRARYVGTTVRVARDRLEGRGLTTSVRLRDNPGGHTEGVVTAVTPYGLVAPGSAVTLVAWGAPPAAQPPQHEDEKKPAKHGNQDKVGHPGKAKGKKQR